MTGLSPDAPDTPDGREAGGILTVDLAALVANWRLAAKALALLSAWRSLAMSRAMTRTGNMARSTMAKRRECRLLSFLRRMEEPPVQNPKHLSLG